MNPSGWQEWLAWAGLVLPLSGIAWAAVSYVWVERKKEKQGRYDQFFLLMEQIGMIGYSAASKMAALSELKNYPEYKEVIVRFCLNAEFEGHLAHMLEKETNITLKYFGHKERTSSPHGGEDRGEGA